MRKSIMTIAMHHDLTYIMMHSNSHDVCETNGFKILISPTIPFFSHIFIHTYTQSYMIKLLVVRGDNHIIIIIIIKDGNNSNYY